MIDQLDSGESPITYVEYFIDTDPGFGNGNQVTVTPGTTVDLAFMVDLENLEPGIHFINVRSKSENETWCQVYSQLFLLENNASTGSPNIVLLEYFVDEDPGFGSGTIVPTLQPSPVVDENFVADISTFATGEHKFFVRAKDEFDNWSMVAIDTFNLEPATEFAIRFDGENDFMEAGEVSFPNGDLTIEAWINPVEIYWIHALVHWYGQDAGVQFRVNQDGSLLYGESAGGNWNWVITESQTILTDQWTHVAMTKSDNLCTLYVNGTEAATGNVDNNPVTGTLDFGGRGNVNDRFFKGLMDEVRIWNVARTQEEIAGNLCTNLTGNEPGLYGLWHFDDGVGSPVATDSGPNGFGAWLYNMNPGPGAESSWIEHACNVFYADFTANVFSGEIPLEVAFSDLSVGIIDSWSWDFGDGATSNDQNPVHHYEIPGIYNVALTISNSLTTSTRTRIGFIEATVVPLVPDFIADITSGFAPLTVSFTDLSTGNPEIWLWDFGDGAFSDEQNPVHTFTNAGSYDISLTVSNSFYTESTTSFQYIEVLAPEPLVPDFVADITSGFAPLTVSFTDLSTGNPETWLWDFGDGTFSEEQNPLHTFTNAGSYDISLTVSNSFYTENTTSFQYIEVLAPEPLIPDFVADITSGFAPLTVSFTDLSTGNPEIWLWDFGDGAFSDEQNPVHTFTNAGSYDISLTVSNSFYTESTTSFQYIEVLAPEPLVPDFVADITSGFAPLTVSFTDLSTGNPEIWLWDFGDGAFSDEQNPVHTYTSFGNFTVSLSISKNSQTNTVTQENYITVYQTQNGDWSLQQVCLENTPEAALMIRTGDIDNLGFGWPLEFDPFSGESTPGHGFPWLPDPADAPGTDKIMVVSGYTGNSVPCGTDGYTNTTSRPENLPEPVIIHLCQPSQGGVNSAVLQVFVDDFQPQTFCSEYAVKLNGYTFDNLQTIVNYLDQTGPIGRMLTVRFPDELLYLLQGEQLELEIDDTETGAGDGFAIDFVKLLINEGTLAHSGTIAGIVYNLETGLPVEGAEVEASFWSSAVSGSDGNYSIQEVPAGMVYLECQKIGYATSHQIVNLESGTTLNADFWLEPELLANFEASPTTGFAPLEVQFTDFSTGNPETWFWDFGDGTTSNEQNPMHIYESTGWFDVTLTVSKGNNQDIFERQAYIHVTEMPLGEKVAEYFFDVDPGYGQANPVYSEDGFEMVNFTPDVSELSDGQHTLYLRSRSETGNWSQTLNRPFLVSRLISDNQPVIEQWEYFVDVDPGFGNGILIQANHLPMDEFIAEIPLPNYSNGIHNLFFRALDNHGKWSGTNCRSFLKTTLPADITGITRIEYFIDVDPGLGQGHPVGIQQVGKTVVQNFLINLSLQQAGEHRLFVRSADNHGRWSLVISALFTVEEGTGIVQIIDLKEGWSGISGYIVPDEPSLENLFSTVQNDLIILQNFEGMYWPTNTINTLVDWNSQLGYQVKMSAHRQLTLTGNMQQELTLMLDEGWNYLPVPTACSNNVEELFEPLGSHLQIVKEIAGLQVYWPQFGIATLSELQPGKAYFINLDQPVNLTFPVCNSLKETSSNNLNPDANKEYLMAAGLQITTTPLTHVVALTREAATGMEVGDILTITNHAGNCFGAAVFRGENLAITIFGDDPLTPETDGMTEGELMFFSLWKKTGKTETPLQVDFDERMPQTGYFTNQGLSAIAKIEGIASLQEPGSARYVDISPNPSTGIFYVHLTGIAEQVQWKILSTQGLEIISERTADQHFMIDLSHQPKGIYFLRIADSGTPILKKLVIE